MRKDDGWLTLYLLSYFLVYFLALFSRCFYYRFARNMTDGLVMGETKFKNADITIGFSE